MVSEANQQTKLIWPEILNLSICWFGFDLENREIGNFASVLISAFHAELATEPNHRADNDLHIFLM